MEDNKNYKIGILAFGSLINNPGKEISEITETKIDCDTPFKVEFARVSSTRGNAPTLIPFENGKIIKAKIIILQSNTDINTAKDILWRRELHKKDKTKKYTHKNKQEENDVVIEKLDNFMNVTTVLYTSIYGNIKQTLTGELLADFAIKSILSKAGQEEKDGIRYLLAAKRNGIITLLSNEYEKQILHKTKTTSLEEAIEKLDRQRMMYPIIQIIK